MAKHLPHYKRHIDQLAREHGITVRYGTTEPCADPRTKTASVPVLSKPESYAAALHELGHVVYAQQRGIDYAEKNSDARAANLFAGRMSIKIIVDEMKAWEWAMKQVKFTPRMTSVAALGLASYVLDPTRLPPPRRDLERYGVKKKLGRWDRTRERLGIYPKRFDLYQAFDPPDQCECKH